MKLLVTFVFIILFVWINNFKSYQTTSCEINMTKSELLDGKLTFNCDYLKNQELVSFKIKVPKKPTVIVYGDSLYNEARTYVKNINKGNIITFFDIETQSKTDNKDKFSIVVTIVD